MYRIYCEDLIKNKYILNFNNSEYYDEVMRAIMFS